MITHFQEATDLEGNPSGNYKYVGYDQNAYNEQIELDDETNSGFDFVIAADSGW